MLEKEELKKILELLGERQYDKDNLEGPPYRSLYHRICSICNTRPHAPDCRYHRMINRLREEIALRVELKKIEP